MKNTEVTKEQFRAHLAAAKAAGVTDSDLISAFGASAATIVRWASGEACPHRLARPVIVRWLRART